MVDKACKNCKRIVESGSECPICKSEDLTTSWKGIVVVYDVESSKIADEADINSPGRYAIRVKS
ncbi:MAG: DNA-directed RNA polymerase, subunit E'' [Candidatus Nanohaloarchaeota archaeon QJJ-9]|nr:DNA-directed RNA polymerase, subunit E'' [Candidatus Nanohaloarchaeota archaeon QJJ-9]